MKNRIKIFLILLFILSGIISYFVLDLNHYLTFGYIKSNQIAIESLYAHHQFTFILGYFLIYIVSTALSFPGATILTLLGGAIFGLPLGLLIVSFASSIGATLAFLMSRTLFKSYIEKHYEKTLNKINDGLERDGSLYLLSLRLVPLFPFFLINLCMGLTKISILKFYTISQIGMFIGTAIYVNAGVRLSEIESISGILNSDVIFSFVLLGIFPWIGKWIKESILKFKIYKDYKKPKKFDYNLIVIGGGAAGLVSSYIASAVKAKVLLIEKNKMGGDCLNTGCVPSKALIKAAKISENCKKSAGFGINISEYSIDFKKVMEHVKTSIFKIEPHDSVDRYTNLGVDCIKGEARIVSPWEVEVNDRLLTTKNIVIATGAAPSIPAITGLIKDNVFTSESIWNLDYKPDSLAIIGGGFIGIELAQAFSRLQINVHLFESGSRLLQELDFETSKFVLNTLRKSGVHVYLETDIREVITDGDVKKIAFKQSEKNDAIGVSDILVATGRKANTKGFGLEELGLTLNKDNTISTNEFLQTNFPNVYACGDVAGPYQLTHVSSHQAWYCAVNSLFGTFKKFKVDYDIIPKVLFLDPEIAMVGKTEIQLKRDEIDFEITKYEISDSDRAITEGEDLGYIKVYTPPNKDKILGVVIVSTFAGEMITEFVHLMKMNKGLNQLLNTIHAYPTYSEANKAVAGVWKNQHKPHKLLNYLEKFHAFRR